MEQEELIRRLQNIVGEAEGIIQALKPSPDLVEVVDRPLDTSRQIAWGARVSAQFKAGVLWIEDEIGINADYLMACMAFETAQTFRPDIKNFAGSSGTGLIQFMSFTAKALGTTVEKLAQMSAVRQLGYVYKYFRQFGKDFSNHTLEDIYMCILFPKAVGKPQDWQMPWKYGSLAYKQNSGLDLNKDQVITKFEASAGVRKTYQIGLLHKG